MPKLSFCFTFRNILSLLFYWKWPKMKDIAVLGSPIIIFMLSSNQIAGFFNHQYLRKQCIHILDFLRGDFTKKRYHEGVPFGWVSAGMPNHSQICRYFPGVPLVNLRGISRQK